MDRILAVLFFLSIGLYSCKKDENSSNRLSFGKTYGTAGDESAKAICLANNQLYILANSDGFGDPNGDLYLFSIDEEGNTIVSETYGSAFKEEADDILFSSDGNLMLLGRTKNTTNNKNDILLIKCSLDGIIIWEKQFGGAEDDFANNIIELNNGNFLITGATTSYGEGSSDIYLLWIDENGNSIKEVLHGDVDQDGGTQSIELDNSDIMLYGYTWNYGAVSRDYFLLKMNAQGDSIWSKRFGGEDYEESQAFSETNDGHFILNGHSASTDPIHDMYGVKVNQQGNLVWDKNMGGALHDGGMAFLINKRGNYVFVAKSMSFGGNQNILMITTKPNGITIDESIIGGPDADMANDIIEYNSSYYLVGQSNSFGNGDLDAYVIKVASK